MSLLRRLKKSILSRKERTHDRQQEYLYSPLHHERKEIRLLQILPNDLEDEPISFCMVHTRLQDAPPYTALSYCWGGMEHREDIFIDGRTLTITQNLALAIRHIRKHIASGAMEQQKGLLFWIDAISINQQDNAERSHQVSLMRDVYASAANVTSWLGHGEELILSALSFIRNVVQAANFPNPGSNRTIKKLGNIGCVETYGMPADGVGEVLVDPRLLYLFSLSESVIEFFKLAYWHRIWVVQEVVLANPKGNVLIYGDELLTFHDVQTFRDSWLAFLKSLQLEPEWETTLSKNPGWESISESWHPYLQRMEKSLVVWSYYDFLRGISAATESLFYIILSTAYHKSDPRDGVFALLGMGPAQRLTPDYAKPCGQIYTEWFISVLQDWKDLQPLYFSGGSSRSSHLQIPSWVPNLSFKIDDSPVWDATLSNTIEDGMKRTDFSFGRRKSGKFPLISHNSTVLHASGIWCDEIAEVFRIDFEHAAEQLLQISTSFLADDTKQIYRTGIPILQAIFRVLMCGINRFAPAETQSEAELISRDFQIAIGTDQLQLNETMPLLQAVAKFLVQKGEVSADNPNDFVLRSLCKNSFPIGSNLASDIQLAAAFVMFLASGKKEESTSSLLKRLRLSNGSNTLQAFVDCFFTGQRAAIDHSTLGDLLSNDKVMMLVNNIHRYFKTYDHTFFLTSTGFLGNGPIGMSMGDRVAMFEGAKIPFIVSSTESSNTLVGPCYVEGLSSGEPAAMARRGELVVQEIALS